MRSYLNSRGSSRWLTRPERTAEAGEGGTMDGRSRAAAMFWSPAKLGASCITNRTETPTPEQQDLEEERTHLHPEQ